MTVTGLGSTDAVTIYTLLQGSTPAVINTILDYVSTSGTAPYRAIPVTYLKAGELQQVQVVSATLATNTYDRLAGVFFHTPTDQTIALGPLLSPPTVTESGAPNAWPRVLLPGQAPYNRLLHVDYSQVDLASQRYRDGGLLWGRTSHLGRFDARPVLGDGVEDRVRTSSRRWAPLGSSRIRRSLSIP